MTWNEQIIKVIKDAERPLQFKEICISLHNRGVKFNPDSIRVYLSTLCKESQVMAMKLSENKPMFYANPDWVEDGQLKFQFNPNWDKLNLL